MISFPGWTIAEPHSGIEHEGRSAGHWSVHVSRYFGDEGKGKKKKKGESRTFGLVFFGPSLANPGSYSGGGGVQASLLPAHLPDSRQMVPSVHLEGGWGGIAVTMDPKAMRV